MIFTREDKLIGVSTEGARKISAKWSECCNRSSDFLLLFFRWSVLSLGGFCLVLFSLSSLFGWPWGILLGLLGGTVSLLYAAVCLIWCGLLVFFGWSARGGRSDIWLNRLSILSVLGSNTDDYLTFSFLLVCLSLMLDYTNYCFSLALLPLLLLLLAKSKVKDIFWEKLN